MLVADGCYTGISDIGRLSNARSSGCLVRQIPRVCCRVVACRARHAFAARPRLYSSITTPNGANARCHAGLGMPLGFIEAAVKGERLDL
ncbi:hypothetical protein MES4922_110136 [Mesorhizobium ventifaucium]|uniref:Uncharacterized protein n=1 Tax=Mesorhizobium ventifaucium TaxID=666020 RepID=A0ABN8J989_9HYPH|nr:hypothetical protein MES4922_110136 [Mesorhizobium ventifaucium]